MPKAIISNRIYLENPGTIRTKEIVNNLTYKIKKDTGSKRFQVIETIRNFKQLAKGIISIPQGRHDLIPADYEVIDKRVKVPVPFPKALHPLFPEQQIIYDQIDDSCFINALVGWGKTFTALHVAKKLGQKTLVVTHTAAIRDQWIEEVEILFGMKAGVIGGGTIDYEDHAIVVANVQTLVKHAARLAKEFGTIILDEAHHVPATTFASIIDSFYARYRIALSGTMQRKDGKHVMFRDFFGDKIFRPPASNTLTPTVKLIRPGISLAHNASWSEKITQLANDETYQRFIAALALSQVAIGHKVLVIADRIELLTRVTEFIGSDAVLVTGETDNRDVAKEMIINDDAQVICGSRQIFSEGISVNPLSCVILAVPLSNDSLLEQIIGRIQRLYEGKLNPLVLDIQFSGYADKKQNEARIGFYMRKGWDIITV